MTEAEIYAALTEIFHDLLGDEALVLRPGLTADQVEGWDSFNHLNIIVAVEARFGIRLKTEEIEKMTNVGSLVRTIQEKLGRAAA